MIKCIIQIWWIWQGKEHSLPKATFMRGICTSSVFIIKVCRIEEKDVS